SKCRKPLRHGIHEPFLSGQVEKRQANDRRAGLIRAMHSAKRLHLLVRRPGELKCIEHPALLIPCGNVGMNADARCTGARDYRKSLLSILKLPRLVLVELPSRNAMNLSTHVLPILPAVRSSADFRHIRCTEMRNKRIEWIVRKVQVSHFFKQLL